MIGKLRLESLRRSISILSFFVILWLFSISIGNVSKAFAIAVSPSRTEVKIPAGGKYYGEFVITNTGNKPIKAIIFKDKPAIGSEKEEVSRWLRFYTNEVEIPPLESRTVQYEISVPKYAKGEYAPTVIFHEKPLREKVQVYAQIKMPVYIIIEGTEVYKGKLESVNVLSANPVVVSVRVNNTGNIHVRPTGKLVIKKISAKKNQLGSIKRLVKRKRIPTKASEVVMEIELNRRLGPIFGGGIGDIGTKVDKELAPGLYVGELELNYTEKIVFRKRITFQVDKEGRVRNL